jgi:ubiquitin C-terminal hydrolase
MSKRVQAPSSKNNSRVDNHGSSSALNSSSSSYLHVGELRVTSDLTQSKEEDPADKAKAAEEYPWPWFKECGKFHGQTQYVDTRYGTVVDIEQLITRTQGTQPANKQHGNKATSNKKSFNTHPRANHSGKRGQSMVDRAKKRSKSNAEQTSNKSVLDMLTASPPFQRQKPKLNMILTGSADSNSNGASYTAKHEQYLKSLDNLGSKQLHKQIEPLSDHEIDDDISHLNNAKVSRQLKAASKIEPQAEERDSNQPSIQQSFFQQRAAADTNSNSFYGKKYTTGNNYSGYSSMNRLGNVSSYSYNSLSKSPWRNDNIQRTGFRNVGNSCYMNAVLQCLLSLSHFTHDICSEQFTGNTPRALLRPLAKNSFYAALLTVISQRRSDSHGVIDTKQLKDAFGNKYKRFAGYQQQDAHEFLTQCLNHITEDIALSLAPSSQLEANNNSPANKPTAKGSNRNNSPDEQNQTLFNNSPLQRDKSPAINSAAIKPATQQSVLPSFLDEILEDERKEGPSNNDSSTVVDMDFNAPFLSDEDKENKPPAVGFIDPTDVSMANIHSDDSYDDVFLIESPHPGASSSPPIFIPPAVIKAAEEISPSQLNFHCSVEYDLRCTKCDNSRKNVEHFNILSLDIPDKPSKNSTVSSDFEFGSSSDCSTFSSNYPSHHLDDLLQGFFQPTVLELKCPQANCDSNSVQVRCSINKLPRILILHIKRFKPSKSFTGEYEYKKVKDVIYAEPSIQLEFACTDATQPPQQTMKSDLSLSQPLQTPQSNKTNIHSTHSNNNIINTNQTPPSIKYNPAKQLDFPAHNSFATPNKVSADDIEKMTDDEKITLATKISIEESNSTNSTPSSASRAPNGQRQEDEQLQLALAESVSLAQQKQAEAEALDQLLAVNPKYSLKAIVHHCGYSHTSGHYIADIKYQGSWRRYDDSIMESKIWSDVRSTAEKEGYIFFYEFDSLQPREALSAEQSIEKKIQQKKKLFNENSTPGSNRLGNMNRSNPDIHINNSGVPLNPFTVPKPIKFSP